VNFRKINWQLWVGLVTSFVALASYPFVFVQFPITRNFPWANLLLFALAAVLLWVGVRRAFAGDNAHPGISKIVASVVALLGVAVFAMFVFAIFIGARQLPASKGAPQIGQKAPEFTLADTNGKAISLAELLTTPINGKAPRGVLLVFYRGYW